MPRVSRLCLVGALLVAGSLAPLEAGDPIFRSQEGTQRILLDAAMQPQGFPPIALAFITPPYPTAGGLMNILDCRAVQKRGGQVVGGNRIELDPEVIDLDTGNTLANPPRRSTLFKPFALQTFALGDFSGRFGSTEEPAVGVTVEGQVVGNQPIDELRVTCAGKNRERCQADGNTLCLAGNKRFKVTAQSQAGGPAGVFGSGPTAGDFFFFSPSNRDLLVRILNGCANNGHYWVFYSATTNIAFDLQVVDTQSGESRAYHSPLGQPAQAILDTSAFATCP